MTRSAFFVNTLPRITQVNNNHVFKTDQLQDKS